MSQSLIDHYVGQYTWPRFKALNSLANGKVEARKIAWPVRNWLENSGMIVVDGPVFRINERGREVLAEWRKRWKE